jgi:hypothetical protein
MTLYANFSARARALECLAWRDRLQAAAMRLRERLTKVRAGEEDDRRRKICEQAQAERDELAAELARVYPRSPRSSLTCSGASAPATIASST